MRIRTSAAVALLWAALTASCGGDGVGQAPPQPRLNVVLISIDSLRADRLGCYGHRPAFAPQLAVSPNLDALAKDGALFDSAWSTTSWTLPAHMALLTGLPDRLHGVVSDEFALSPARRSVAQEFMDAGYATAGFYSGPYLDPLFGFGRGFDRYESAMTPLEQAPPEQVERIRQELTAMQAPVTAKNMTDRWSHWDVTSPRVNAGALDFVEQNRERPFFLFLHYFDAHFDYLPDQAEPDLGRKFDPAYTGTMTGANWYFNPQVFDPATRERRIGERDLQHVLALYDAEIHWVDRHIGAVIQRLKDLGLYENTIICVTSDHGDEFFDHGGIGHRSTLYRELTQVPLLLRIPGGTMPGKRVAALVRLYDIAPTLLDYACGGALAESPGATLRPLLEGRSEPERVLAQRIFGYLYGQVNIREGYRSPRHTVLRRLTVDLERMTDDELFVRQETWDERQPKGSPPKYFVFDPSERGELRALAAGDPRYAAALDMACAAYRELEERFRRLPGADPAPAGADPAEAARLAALGYAAGPADTRQLAPFPPPCPD